MQDRVYPFLQAVQGLPGIKIGVGSRKGKRDHPILHGVIPGHRPRIAGAPRQLSLFDSPMPNQERPTHTPVVRTLVRCLPLSGEAVSDLRTAHAMAWAISGGTALPISALRAS